MTHGWMSSLGRQAGWRLDASLERFTRHSIAERWVSLNVISGRTFFQSLFLNSREIALIDAALFPPTRNRDEWFETRLSRTWNAGSRLDYRTAGRKTPQPASQWRGTRLSGTSVSVHTLHIHEHIICITLQSFHGHAIEGFAATMSSNPHFLRKRSKWTVKLKG